MWLVATVLYGATLETSLSPSHVPSLTLPISDYHVLLSIIPFLLQPPPLIFLWTFAAQLLDGFVSTSSSLTHISAHNHPAPTPAPSPCPRSTRAFVLPILPSAPHLVNRSSWKPQLKSLEKRKGFLRKPYLPHHPGICLVSQLCPVFLGTQHVTIYYKCPCNCQASLQTGHPMRVAAEFPHAPCLYQAQNVCSVNIC